MFEHKRTNSQRTMAEIKVVGLVGEEGDTGMKSVTLRHQFDWFLSELEDGVPVL
jgi:hypothetical protein